MGETYSFPGKVTPPPELPLITTAQFGAAPSYPFLMDGGANIALQFSEDTDVGVVFDFLRHKPGTDFDFITSLVDTAALPELDGRLWEITYTLKPNTTPEATKLSPRDATSFQSYDASSTYPPAVAALLMVWNGIEVPGSLDGDRLKVVALVRINADDELSHWNIWVTRERGESVSIEEVAFPVLWIKGPSTEEGGESHLEGQKRTRVLIPVNAIGASSNPSTASNSDLFTWADTPLEALTAHPAAGQPMQFAAVMSAHDNVDNAYLRVLYLSSEDTGGRPKRFKYRGYNHTNAVDDGYLRYAVSHLPTFQANLGDGSATDWSNDYAMPYTVAIGALSAGADGQFWFDVAAKYRERIVALGAMPAEIESNPRLSSSLSRGPAMWLGAIVIDTFGVVPEQERYDRFRTYIDMLRSGTRGAHAPHDLVWAQIQTWAHASGITNPPANPNDPLYGPADGLIDFVVAARGDGIICYGYTRPGDMFEDRGWVFPKDVVRKTRSGALNVANGLVRLDDSDARNQWWVDNITSFIKSLGFRGQYMDGFGGGPGQVSYPSGGVVHPRHGGTWGNDARDALVTMVRDRINHPDSVLGIEAVQEWISEGINIQQTQVLYAPGAMQLAEEAVRVPMTNVPLACRHMNPPLWEAVYHGHIPSQTLGFHMGNCFLDTNTDWNPRAAIDGLTAAEFTDCLCWFYATCFASGNLPLLMQCQLDLDGHDPAATGSPSGISNAIQLYDERGGTRTDPTKDPTSAGKMIMEFMRVLHQVQVRDFAGDMVLFGQLLRPLTPDYTSANNSRATNPMSALDPANINLAGGRIWMLPAAAAVALLTNATIFSQSVDAGFEVPDALFQMWQSPEGVVGLVVVNWTGSDATFNATFNPATYGVTAPYDIIQRNLGASPTTLASSVAAGDHVIGNSGTVDTTLPDFTARSVHVFTFETS